MARNILNLNFNLRNPSCQHPTPINLVIRYNAQKVIYPTAESIHPKHWQNEKRKKGYQRVRQNAFFPEFPEFNARLDNIEKTTRDVFRKFLNDNENKPPSVRDLRRLLDIAFKRINTPGQNFLRYISDFIESSKTRTNPKTGRTISPLTLKKYKSTMNHLKHFCSSTGKYTEFEEIDSQFYHEYMNFLAQEYNLSVNSIGKDIACIKAFLNDATDKGINKNRLFQSSKFSAISEKSDSIYLNLEELNQLYQLDLTANKTLEKVRDLFLIGCFTGLRYSDFSVLNSEHIVNNRIQIETYKTGETVIIPLHPIVKSIFQKYYYSLPKSLSNQKTNLYLKEVGKRVTDLSSIVTKRITKGGLRLLQKQPKYQLITTHTARRSFATNLYLDNFPAISIMKITGHRTEGAFMRYIKITPEENAVKLDQHWQKIGMNL